jgi:serine phosphatase RsbU (regulator of sigma subunit)
VREGSAETIKDAVLTNVNAFTNEKFEDDATLIVVGIA